MGIGRYFAVGALSFCLGHVASPFIRDYVEIQNLREEFSPVIEKIPEVLDTCTDDYRSGSLSCEGLDELVGLKNEIQSRLHVEEDLSPGKEVKLHIVPSNRDYFARLSMIYSGNKGIYHTHGGRRED